MASGDGWSTVSTLEYESARDETENQMLFYRASACEK